MSQQTHLYGIDYTEYNPPLEWQGMVISGSYVDDKLEATISNTEFTFVGEIAKFVKEVYIPAKGVFNGLHYRINVRSEFTGIERTVFDGYIDLSQMVWLSKGEPTMFKAPIVEFSDNPSVFDQLAIISQGYLEKKGFLGVSNYFNIPCLYESKENLPDRLVVLAQYANSVASAMLGAIQDFLSALSDILGVSIPIGIIELGTMLVNVFVQVKAIKVSTISIIDNYFPLPVYYKGIKPKQVIEQAFKSINASYVVDWGELEPVLNNVYLLPSQRGVKGFLIPSPLGSGILQRNDQGYYVGVLLEIISNLFNCRQRQVGNTIHIKTKRDAYWSTAPELEIDNILFGTTEQYSNGTFRNKTEEVYATWYGSYAVDESDPHTLTNFEGNEHEVHRSLSTIVDDRTVTLRGLKAVDIPYAMAVRKKPFDNLLDLFGGIGAKSDEFLKDLQDIISTYNAEISDASLEFDASGYLTDILTTLPFVGDKLSRLLEKRTGVLKLNDDAFNMPKICYLETVDGELKLKENYKEVIGMPNIYNYYHSVDSPAVEFGYHGQHTEITNAGIKFNVDSHDKVATNPNIAYSGKIGKFTNIDWSVDTDNAITNIEINEPFDTKITEEEV